MCKWSSDSFVQWTDSCLSSPISTSGVTSPSLSAQQLPCPQWNHLQFPCHTRRAITLTACHPLISCDKPNLGTVLSISTNYVFLFIYPTLAPSAIVSCCVAKQLCQWGKRQSTKFYCCGSRGRKLSGRSRRLSRLSQRGKACLGDMGNVRRSGLRR